MGCRRVCSSPLISIFNHHQPCCLPMYCANMGWRARRRQRMAEREVVESQQDDGLERRRSGKGSKPRWGTTRLRPFDRSIARYAVPNSTCHPFDERQFKFKYAASTPRRSEEQFGLREYIPASDRALRLECLSVRDVLSDCRQNGYNILRRQSKVADCIEKNESATGFCKSSPIEGYGTEQTQ